MTTRADVPVPVRAIAPRELTFAEQSGLEGSITQVRALVRPLDRGTVQAWWSRLLAEVDPGDRSGARFVGVALGTLLTDQNPQTRWVACLGPAGWTPGVVCAAHPTSPVLVVADALAHWQHRDTTWPTDYVDLAREHLAAPATPEPAAPDPAEPEVAALAAAALQIGLARAGDRPLALAVLPDDDGPRIFPSPADPADHDAVRAWGAVTAGGAGSRLLALVWVDPPHRTGRHAAGRAGSVLVEAGAAGRAGIGLAREFEPAGDGARPLGAPIPTGPVPPLL